MSRTGDPRYVPALGFHWLTPAYDVVVRTTTRERTFKTALIEQADVGPHQQVLDLACGTGTLAIWLKQRHPSANVRAIDGDPKILAIASRKAQQANVPIGFDRGLSFSLPYPDAAFDRVLSSLFFHHLGWRDKQRTARELYRVIRPGGQLHVADWGRARGPLMRAAFFAVQLIDGFENTQGNVEGRLVELFREAGFADVSERRAFATVFGTLSLYRSVKPQSGRADDARGDRLPVVTERESCTPPSAARTKALATGVVAAILLAGSGAGSALAASHHTGSAPGSRLGSTTAMAKEMQALREDIQRLKSQMERISQSSSPSERQQLTDEHLVDLRRAMMKLQAMEPQMIDDVNKGRIVSDGDLRNRQQLLAEQTTMLLEMLEQAIKTIDSAGK